MTNSNQLAEMLQIQDGKIQGEEQKLINARDLHSFLEIQTSFKDWIERRLEKYGFELGEDFLVLKNEQQNGSGGHNRKEVILTLDTAKEISMVENNEKGREARKYFLSVEKAFRSENKLQLPQTFPEALRALAEVSENNDRLELIIKEAMPKVGLADTFLTEGKGELTFDDWANGLGDGLGRNTLFKILKVKGYLCQDNSPKQTQINNSNFSVKHGSFTLPNGEKINSIKTLVTKKGMTRFSKEKLLKWKEELPKNLKEPKTMEDGKFMKIVKKYLPTN